ncbi:hypothetical protein [Methylobrevis pamukkalensis]|uniref:Sulfotransferase domain protein n=1 Tax=Methylobrevis pamukkalensis TaxID=1439726 RepID=A0A1E3H3Y6_9HYPH|nr:hypothetical protein [Methylobrevis pamukkalensis]ODN71014.1 hypothetical protein A6302_01648 [Methylobrevis pamukkalensis]
MRTIIHIGTHKTGTTTIQHFAKHNARKLRQKGFWYPGYDMIGRKGRYAHHDFSHAIAGQKSANLSLQDTIDFVEAIRQNGLKATPPEIAFLSAEPIYRHMLPPAKPEDEDSYWAGRERYVARLAEITAPLAPEILMVVRRQDDFARSLFQENVKSNRVNVDFLSFVEDNIGFFEYNRQYELFKKYFPIVRVLVFEDLANDGKLVREFFEQLGCKTGRMKLVPELNESLPMELTEYKRLLNDGPFSRAQLTSVAKHLLEMRNDKAAFPKEAKLDWISTKQMTTLMRRFDASNRALYKAMDVKPDRKTLFPPAKPREGVFPGLSMQRFVEINNMLLKRLVDE